jgi:hypothetical protein
MKECDKRKSHISSELHLIYIYIYIGKQICLEGLLCSIKQVFLPVIMLLLLTKSVFRLQHWRIFNVENTECAECWMLDTTSEIVQRFWEVKRSCRLLRHSSDINSVDSVFLVNNRFWARTEESMPVLARVTHTYKTLHDGKLQKNVYGRYIYG